MRYEDIVGQKETVARLKQFAEFFASKGGVPGHILLVGEDGIGKRTIVSAFADELGVPFQSAEGLYILGDLTAILTNVRQGQVLLIENLHSLKRPFLDRLQSLLRDNKVTIVIGQGPSARRHVVDLPAFTFVATCSNRQECPPALLQLFSMILTLQPYSRSELRDITMGMATKSGVALEPTAAELIVRHSDGRPADVELILQRLMRAINKTAITEEDTLQAFSAFGLSMRVLAAPTVNTDIECLSGEDFERLIAVLLARMGFQTQLTSTTGDGGIDIIATLDKPILGGRYLFQCKRFAPDNPVGAPTVRDFYGAVTADRAVKGVFITTSDFTVQAKEFGEKVGLELINLRRLRDLLNEFGAKD